MCVKNVQWICFKDLWISHKLSWLNKCSVLRGQGTGQGLCKTQAYVRTSMFV